MQNNSKGCLIAAFDNENYIYFDMAMIAADRVAKHKTARLRCKMNVKYLRIAHIKAQLKQNVICYSQQI